MGAPLEKIYNLGFMSFSVKQVFDLEKMHQGDESKQAVRGPSVVTTSLYFIPWPRARSSFETELSRLATDLPLSIPVTTFGWYFIEATSTWEEHLAKLKTSHAKKIRRYLRKPAKYKYVVRWEDPKKLSLEELAKCYDLLGETMRHNGDLHFYTKDSFLSHLRSLRTVLVAREDCEILGFYSGAVIGHNHSAAYRRHAVYHNLFLEHVKHGFEEGLKMIDLGNCGDSFKQELGAKSFTLGFSLRGSLSLRSGIALTHWAAKSWLQLWFLQVLLLGLLVYLFWLQVRNWLSALPLLEQKIQTLGL